MIGRGRSQKHKKMKNFSKLAAVAAMALTVAAGASAKGDKRDDAGHVLTEDWKEYCKAEAEDLPQTQEKILSDIIRKAETRKLDWDFYDAAGKYCLAARSYDWKKASVISEDLKKRITEYGSPVVLWNAGNNAPFYLDIPDIRELAADKEKLIQEKNDQFYSADRFLRSNSGRLPSVIVEEMENDYEYLLWSAFMRGCMYSPVRDEKSDSLTGITFASGALKEYYEGKYPQAAYVEFVENTRISDDSTALRKAAMESFINKYRDKGIRFFARMELLRMKFEALQDSTGAGPSDYLALREECAQFERDRKAEKAETALTKMCDYPANLIKKMDFKQIRVKCVEGTDTIAISLQNLGNVRMRLMDRDSTVIIDTLLENRAGSYYVPDTLKFAVSGIDDGRYTVKCSSDDVSASFAYVRNTVSLVLQRQDKGMAAYLADYMTGEPVKKADFMIYYKDSLIRTVRGMDFDGFTLIDADFPEQDDRYYACCSFTDTTGLLRMTRKTSFTPSKPVRAEIRQAPGCIILKDRAAFNPGDTLKFKAILYETFQDTTSAWARTRCRVWTGNDKVTAQLKDAQGNMVGSMDLTVNEFGSASGYFRLPEDRRNGTFTLSITAAGNTLAASTLTVDEFELPTFNAVFEPQHEIMFPGDTVTVKGRLESYAGRSLAAADVSYRIGLWSEVIKEGKLDIGADGSFSLTFTAGNGKDDGGYYYHDISIKVTDATGETHEFSTGVVIYDFYFSAGIENTAEGSVETEGGQARIRDAETDSADVHGLNILEGDFAIVSFDLRNAGNEPLTGEKISYSVSHDGQCVIEGEAETGEKTWIDLSSWPSGTYRLKASVEVEGRKKTCVYDLIKTAAEDEALHGKFLHFIKILPSEDIVFQFGASDGPVWAAVQLFGGADTCLKSEMIHMEGVSGEKGSLETVTYDFKDEYPDVTELKITYFRDGEIHEYSHDFRRAATDMTLPLTFSRFTDKAWPGEKCVYEITTLPGVECAVSVFDVTTEAFRTNWWNTLAPWQETPYVYRTYSTGRISGSGWSSLFRMDSAADFGRSEAIPFQMASAAPRYADDAVIKEESVQNTLMTKSSGGLGISAPEISIRENFADALAFYPFLRSDKDGKIRFEFTAGDKLSTYYVSLFAHDKSMNNNVLRQKMQITLPVTVSVAQPAYLYSGDKYDLQVSLSNTSGSDSEGTLSVYLYDGSDHESGTPYMVMSKPAGAGKGSASTETFTIEVPSDTDTLGIKTVYCASDGASDGLFVAIPVSAPVQTLKESHSALLSDGMSRDSLYAALRNEFVNVSGYGAVPEEISIADMLREAVPDTVRSAAYPDAISSAEAYFTARLAHFLKGDSGDCAECGKLCTEMLSYQNTTGGFAWLKGGPSSPAVTAAVLEYIAVSDSKGLPAGKPELHAAAEKAVKYLDSYYFSDERLSSWAGDLSLPQYLYVRSMFADLPLSAGIGRKETKAFAKTVKQYVYGTEDDGRGYILYKARRAMTVLNFIGSSDERDGFLQSAGLKAGRKFHTRLEKYMASLKEYAVSHKSGGKYYPNAVLPFRGLLENELYAHSMLCRLLSDYGRDFGDSESSEIADGIRLWIMIQKETQDWDGDPAFMLAINAVSEGSPELLSAKVLILTMKYRKPFSEIKAAGNDISVKCRYFVEDGSAGKDAEYEGLREISSGDTLKVGDRITAVYEIWSAENRSFVRLNAPRAASLRPENQLSGPYGYGIRSSRAASRMFRFAPYAYREVKSDRSIWYIDVLAEEKTVITEDLVVTQSGTFSSPVTDIECLYAPHYRANDGFHPQLLSR